MKRICFHLFLISGVGASGNFTYGVPAYLDQNTNTIETYSPPLGYTRSHAHGAAFANNLKSNLNANFPSISIGRADRQDASVTYPTLVNDVSMNYYEMVFFSGHGNIGTPGDNTGNNAAFITNEHGQLAPSSRSYGGWTRWVFADFCQFLRNHNSSFYSTMFNGLHAVFGYESNMEYYIISYNCWCFGGCCSHHMSETKYENFAAKWAAKNGMGLWDAWTQANQEIQYSQGGYGNAPAVVYNFYFGWQGMYYFDGSQERINTIFNGDVPTNTLNHKFVTFGTPTYN